MSQYKRTTKTIAIMTATVKGIDSKTGQERTFTAKTTVRGQNPKARAIKALRSMIANQKPWMLLEPIKFEEAGQ